MDFIPSLRAWLVSFLNGIPSDDPASATLYLFLHGGWAVLLVVLLVTMVQLWLESRRDRYAAGVRWVLLAIDVPKETEQSPQAVEHVFSALAGTHLRGTLVDRWWHGKTQSYFSFEIVSLGGYTQFLVRTPVNFRDLVEASLYAQYPDAEVTEVEDYVGRIPLNFDTEEYDLWGTEFQLMKLDVYPIKTYPEFEHTLSQEFKDPMAGLLEILSRIKPDEDVWLQLVVTPTDDSWKNQAKKEVQRIISKKEGSGGLGGVLTSLLFQLPAKFLYTVTETVFSGVVEPGKSTVSTGTLEKKPHTVQELTPGEKDVVVAIERKASKIGFKTKFRLVYWGRRETFLKGRGQAGVVGAIQQFTTLNLNGLKPSRLMTTKAEYFLKQSRINNKQRRILRHYAGRSNRRGHGEGFILNTEELATLYHFPVVTVKAPLVKKTEAKKAEPPFGLPVYQPGRRLAEPQPAAATGKGAAPGNLPTVE